MTQSLHLLLLCGHQHFVHTSTDAYLGFEFTLLAGRVSASTTIQELANASYAVLVNLAILLLL